MWWRLLSQPTERARHACSVSCTTSCAGMYRMWGDMVDMGLFVCFHFRQHWEDRSASLGTSFDIKLNMGVWSDTLLRRARSLHEALFPMMFAAPKTPPVCPPARGSVVGVAHSSFPLVVVTMSAFFARLTELRARPAMGTRPVVCLDHCL